MLDCEKHDGVCMIGSWLYWVIFQKNPQFRMKELKLLIAYLGHILYSPTPYIYWKIIKLCSAILSSSENTASVI